MSICWKEYSGHNYRQGAWEGETPKKAWASWWDATNTSPGWVCVDGCCGASVCGCRNSDLKTAGWRKKNYVLRSSVWKSVRSWQALETSGPGESIRTEKLRPPRACARLSVHADTYKGCTTWTVTEEGGGCCMQPDEARDHKGLAEHPPEALRASARPSASEQPPGLASQRLLQLGSEEWSRTCAWILECTIICY